MKKISIVTPAFNESENLPDYFEKIKQVFINNQNSYQYEFILVDDGSSDNSWEQISAISNKHTEIRGLKLSRNHGAHIALSAGFSVAKGDAIAVLACDLQDPAEIVLKFIHSWEKGNDVIWGVRKERDDLFWKKLTSKIFHKLLKKWAMPKKSQFATGSFLLMDRKVLLYFNQFKEHNRITFAIVGYMGFKQDRVYYKRRKRYKGHSGWGISSMVKAFYDALIAFSYAPIKITRIISLLIMLSTFPMTFYLLYLYNLERTSNLGWLSTILVVSLFGSIILLNISFVLEYLMRVYLNSAQRPLYFISDYTENIDEERKNS